MSYLEEILNGNYPEEVKKAFKKIKREDFLPENIKEYGAFNEALPLFGTSTTSQPTVIARMLALLDLKNAKTFLEVGSGCGFLLRLAEEINKDLKVYGVELNKEVCEFSKIALKKTKSKAKVFCTSFENFLKKNYFDRILFSCALEEIDKVPKNAFISLTENGFILVPIGKRYQRFFKIYKDGSHEIADNALYTFVPYIR